MCYIICLVIVFVDVAFRCVLHPYLVVVSAMFYLLRCIVIYRKISEPSMFDVVSAYVVSTCTAVMFVVLQSTYHVWFSLHEPCMIACVVIVVDDVGFRFTSHQVSSDSNFVLDLLRCSSLYRKQSWLHFW